MNMPHLVLVLLSAPLVNTGKSIGFEEVLFNSPHTVWTFVGYGILFISLMVFIHREEWFTKWFNNKMQTVFEIYERFYYYKEILKVEIFD